MLGNNAGFRVSPVTIHVPLSKVPMLLSEDLLRHSILTLNHHLLSECAIKRPKILVTGLNPHAGENKTISKDDSKYLSPIIEHLKNKKINIKGPVSGDGMINDYNIKNYQIFIFTYHDQALIPFKIISNYEGVNFTSNLSIIRTSPSHGTAESLINSNRASSKGIINCFKLISKISKNREIK